MSFMHGRGLYILCNDICKGGRFLCHLYPEGHNTKFDVGKTGFEFWAKVCCSLMLTEAHKWC